MATQESSSDSLIDPTITARLAAQPLLARFPMEGSVSGMHRSPHRGSSVEFAEYRQYVPGDDLRRLDWRVLGRTDRYYLKEFVGRPTPLYFAERLTRHLGGAKIYLKREDLLHTGAHKINNSMGQILLAKRMGKKRIIAETGAGQHGVATATVAAMFGIECVIYTVYYTHLRAHETEADLVCRLLLEK